MDQRIKCKTEILLTLCHKGSKIVKTIAYNMSKKPFLQLIWNGELIHRQNNTGTPQLRLKTVFVDNVLINKLAIFD